MPMVNDSVGIRFDFTRPNIFHTSHWRHDDSTLFCRYNAATLTSRIAPNYALTTILTCVTQERNADAAPLLPWARTAPLFRLAFCFVTHTRSDRSHFFDSCSCSKKLTPASAQGLIKIYTSTPAYTPKTWNQEVESYVVLTWTKSRL